MPRDPGDWQVILLLCDAAEQVNGKLYILGGGWSKLYRPGQPANFSLAVRVLVPWNQTNERHRIKGILRTEDGGAFQVEGKDLQFEGFLEVGRPPGSRPGMHLDTAVTMNVAGLVLPAGVYRWEFEIDGTVMAQSQFQVLAPPAAAG